MTDLVLHARRALLATGWAGDVRLTLRRGRIAQVETGVAAQAGDERHAILVPGMGNLHSHAFQRAMAGLTEIRGASNDSFWTWRDTMYRFALSMSPQDIEAAAGLLYVEMLEAGYTSVGEFHYLHHDRDGRAYADIGETGARIAAASDETGIGLTLLPVFYAHAGFGGAAATDGQRRFVNDLESYARLLDSSRRAVAAASNGICVGVAPHSLRAATPEELAHVAPMAGDKPIHIHVAEQMKEVEDCVAATGLRPVEWVLRHAPVDHRWCLIHATHMTPEETIGLARSRAVAGICPLTEANLGDGTFDLPRFQEHGGVYGVGSDSNALVGLDDELRQLEYSQRLLCHKRNIAQGETVSTGRTLFDAAIRGGAHALHLGAPGLCENARADIVSLDENHPSLVARTDDALLDGWIFAGGAVVDCVWAAGVKRVEGGRHPRRDAMRRRFADTLKGLVA